MSAEEAQQWSGRAKPGMPLFDGPTEMRDALIRSHGIDWVASYIDPGTWIHTSRAFVPRTKIAHERISQNGSFMFQKLGMTLRAPSNVIRMAAE